MRDSDLYRMTGAAGRDLFRQPLCTEADLGKAIPDSPDACSMALPRWAHAIGYEEKDPAVTGRFECGYPRFFFHPEVAALMADAVAASAGEDLAAHVFPSRLAAETCVRYVAAKTGITPDIAPVTGDGGSGGVHAVLCAAEFAPVCKAFWQHSGLVVSSRRARATRLGRPDRPDAGEQARRAIRERLAGLYGVAPGDVLLYPSGKAAMFAANGLATKRHPGRRRVQLEFPYLDTLKVLEEFADGVSLYTSGDGDGRDMAQSLATGAAPAAIVTEVPSNPLMRTIDFARIAPIARQGGALLIVDDTIATAVNVDVMPYADLVVTSLTKLFCGQGDVMAGALIVNPASPDHAFLSNAAHRQHQELLWWEDAVMLERRSRDLGVRVRRVNQTGEALADYLCAHPAVETVYYPRFDPSPGYGQVKRADGAYGGLMSILLRDAAEKSAPFYDSLAVNKGPSLGTNFTLACPYTLLAHYGELDWAENHGVSRWLIRLSVGMEDPVEMQARFDAAFAAIA